MIISLDTTEVVWRCPTCATENTVPVSDLTAGIDIDAFQIGSTATGSLIPPCSTPGAHIAHQPQWFRCSWFTHERMAFAGLHRYLYDQAQINANWVVTLDAEAAADTPEAPTRPTDAMRIDPTGDTRLLAPLTKIITDGGIDIAPVWAYPMDLTAMLACLTVSECQVLARHGQIFTLDDDPALATFAETLFGTETAEALAFMAEHQRRRLIIA
jgi:hypothetical protein